jgi:hypothetical protein
MKARRARRASPTVKPVEARLTLSCRCFLCNFLYIQGSFCNEQVFILLNMDSSYHIVTIRVI